jgi:hypothetical protein
MEKLPGSRTDRTRQQSEWRESETSWLTPQLEPVVSLVWIIAKTEEAKLEIFGFGLVPVLLSAAYLGLTKI